MRVTTLVSALQTAIRGATAPISTARDQIQAQALLASVVQSSDGRDCQQDPGWHHHLMERGCGATLRLLARRSHRAADHHHHSAGSIRRRSAGSWSESGRASACSTRRRCAYPRRGERLDISVTISRSAIPLVASSAPPRSRVISPQASARPDLLRVSESRFRFLSETIPSIVWTAAPERNDYVRQQALARKFCGIPDQQQAVLARADSASG